MDEKPLDETATDDRSMDERALVQKIIDGDGESEAIDQLLDRHVPALKAFIRLRMGPVLRARESLSDLTQSVCREVIQNIDRLQYPGEKAFKHWLYTTAQRKISNRHEYHTADKRDAGRDMRKSATPKDDDDPMSMSKVYATVYTPSQDAMAKEHVEQVESAFDKLPDDYREVIMLSRFLGLSREEVATEMNRSEGSVRNLLHRALSRLAELLEDPDS